MADPFPSDKLLDLYKIALDEYRFEVRLGWDRTTYFLILNSAILTIATGLLKLDDPPIVYGLIALLFLFGVAISSIGSRSITKAHEYYRRTVVKKTLIEELLGLSGQVPEHQTLNLAIGTTAGQNERIQILGDPETWVNRKHRRTAITFWLRWILRGMAAVDAVGAVTAAVMLYQRLTAPIVAPPPHWWNLLL